MNTRLLLAAVAATASLAACGGGEEPTASPASGGGESANRKAMLDFARCMRENGVDMPDPQFDGGKVTLRQSKTDPETARTAEQACAKYRDAVKPRELSPERQEEFKKAALENARCMREHGIDMPDPQFQEGGGVRMQLGKGIDPSSQKFKDAQEACRGTLPGGAATNVEEGGKR